MTEFLTEMRNPLTRNLDQRGALDIVNLINAEDASVAAAVRAVLPQIAQTVDAVVDRLRAGGRLMYVGAGTSGRLAVLDAVECVPTYSVPPELVVALLAGGDQALTHSIEGAEDDAEAGAAEMRAWAVSARDAVIGVAASGSTPYVVGALGAANGVGAFTAAVSCNAPAPILEMAAVGIAALVGPEVVTGSTRMKAGTAQKMILNMISTASMILFGKVYDNLMVDVKVSNTKLAGRAARIVAEIAGIDEEQARGVLAQTDNEVKTAVVVSLLGVSVQEARQRLAAAGGVLRTVIAPSS